MPAWLRVNCDGKKGEVRTSSISFATGTARLLRKLRLSMRCVLTSARMNLGKQTCNVVRRAPSNDTLSAMTLASVFIA